MSDEPNLKYLNFHSHLNLFHLTFHSHLNLFHSLVTSSSITRATLSPTRLSRYGDAYADPASDNSSTFTPSEPPSSTSSRMIPKGFSKSRDNNDDDDDVECRDDDDRTNAEGLENDSTP